MFEKESKEYANKWLEHVKDLELQHKSDDKPEYIRILEAHQQGAEFGYNKANEWHYVKDGDLPKDDNDVLVLLIDKTVQVDYYFSKIGWNLSVNNAVIAWKEIALPELKESE